MGKYIGCVLRMVTARGVGGYEDMIGVGYDLQLKNLAQLYTRQMSRWSFSAFRD